MKTQQQPGAQQKPDHMLDLLPTQEQKAAWWHEGYEAAFNDLVDTTDAPNSYDDFDLPDGISLVDTDLMDEFQGVARALNLSQRQAQKLIDLYLMHQTRLQQRAVDGWKDVNRVWAEQVTADPELGGEGQTRMLGYARAALKRFGSEDLLEILDHLGVGQHPEILRFFARVGRSLAEDEVVASPLSVSGASQKSLAERLWPNGK